MKLKRLVLLLTLPFFLTFCQRDTPLEQVEQEVKQGAPIMKVGGKTIYEGHFQLLQDTVPTFKANFSDPEGRKKILNKLIIQEVLLKKSRETNLIENNSLIKKQLWLNRRNFESNAYIQDVLDKKAQEKYQKDKEKLYTRVDIADIVFYFEKTGSNDPEEQRHIAMDQAREIRQQLTPQNFGVMAKEHSEDPQGIANYGKLGSISYLDQRVKNKGWGPIVDKAFAMEVGDISEPIETPLGIHLILVQSVKIVQPYEEVKYFVQKQIVKEVQKELFDQLLAETEIEYLIPDLQPQASSDKTKSAGPETTPSPAPVPGATKVKS